MKVLEHRFPAVTSRSAKITIHPLGDVHIGAMHCAEKQFRAVVKMIADDPNAYWFGGGDMIDAVMLKDAKRFDPLNLPAWMLSGDEKKVRMRMGDMITAQRDRFIDMVEPIKDKCIGLIEGNHEYSIMKYHNRNIMKEFCDIMDVPNLTDCCYIRFKFERKKKKSTSETSVVRMFAAHGNGGGRTAGSEPNHLSKLAADKDCELVLRGHSHCQHILPPIAKLSIPKSGALGVEATTTTLRAANWGCFLKTYAAGPSTYDSRATYPVRPLMTIKIDIKPFNSQGNHTCPKISIVEVDMT